MDGSRLARARDAQTEKGRAYWLQLELNAAHRQLSEQYEETLALRKELTALREENKKLHQRLAELTASKSSEPEPDAGSGSPPAFVKPNTPEKRRRKPGRPAGHEAAFRPRSRKIDIHLQVPLPVDRRGQLSCPECHTQLGDVKKHRRLVDDIIPSQVITTCY